MAEEATALTPPIAASTADSAAASSSPPAQSAASRPDYIPETLWDAQKNAPKADFAKDYAELTALRTEREARAKDIPENGAYKFELPPDTLPSDYTFSPDTQNPILQEFLKDAYAAGYTQQQVSVGLAKFAKFLVGMDQSNKNVTAEYEAKRAEALKPLGNDAGQRIDLARRALNARQSVGELTEARNATLASLLHTADGVLFVEDILKSKDHRWRGQPGTAQVPANADLIDGIGKRPVGMDFLRAANSQRAN